LQFTPGGCRRPCHQGGTPRGRFARGYDAAAKGQSSYFVWLNRGKNSVVVDLATKEGRALMEELIAGADVLLQNLKPGSMDKLGFSLERLKKDYPALICCTISGYGDDGPYADRKAYDLLIQAESGLASITGGPEGPSRVGISVVDIATGATAHAAILEALIGRGAHRQGRRYPDFDVRRDGRLADGAAAQRRSRQPPQRMGLAHPSIAPYGVFSSKDGKGILISIQSEREWKNLARSSGQPDLPNDPRLAKWWSASANRALDRQDRRDSFAGADARANCCSDCPMPTSRSRKSTPWPIWRCIRICAASKWIRRTDRSATPRPPRSSSASRALWRGAGDRRARERKLPRADQIVMTEKLDLDHLRHGSAAPPRPPTSSPRNWSRACARPCFRRSASRSRRRRALDRALVPGAAGVSDVGAGPDGHPDPRRLPAAGAAAAPDVGRRRAGISSMRCASAMRRSAPRASRM
jgi:hypothetical protein